MSETNEHSNLPTRFHPVGAALEPYGGSAEALACLAPSTPPLRNYLNALFRRRRIVLLTFVLIFGATCLFTFTRRPVYEATVTLLVSERPGPGGMASGLQDQMPGLAATLAAPSLETHAALMEGESAAAETAAWLRANGGPRLSASKIHHAISADIVRHTQLIRLSARAGTPSDAERIANGAAQAYTGLTRRLAQGSSESASRYLSEQLTKARDNLANAESALRVFKETTGTVAEDADAGALLARAGSLQTELDTSKVDLAQARRRLEHVRSQLAVQNKNIATSQMRDDAGVQQLRARLVDLEGQRLAAQSRYTEAFSGPLKQIDEQIRIAKSQLNAEIQNVVRHGGGDLTMQQALTAQLIQGETEAAAITARLRQQQLELGTVNGGLQRIPARQIALVRLRRQLDVAQNVYSDLLKRSQEVEVGRIMALGNTDIVEPASRPRLPITPNVPLNMVLGLVLALGAGLGLATLLEQLDVTVRDEGDTARFVSAPVLGAVPVFLPPSSVEGLAADHLSSLKLDVYRSLRYALGFVTAGVEGSTILVTSTGFEEGKTTTAVNLAIAAALGGRRAILIDSDLRRPSAHRLLHLSQAKGLSDVLANEASASDVLQDFDGAKLRFIGAGTPVLNPTDLLDSPRLRSLIAELRRQADYVIIDSPPLLCAADSLVLAGVSDAVLMVCVPGSSDRRALQRASEVLGHVGRTISGVVLNKVERRPGYYYSPYAYERSRKPTDSDKDDVLAH